jgi:hypothetical protein
MQNRSAKERNERVKSASAIALRCLRFLGLHILTIF